MLFLSLKDVDGSCFQNAFDMLTFTLSQVCLAHRYLQQDASLDSTYQKTFAALKERTASLQEVKASLLLLMQMMRDHYGKPVILLIDEYDVPIAKASANGYYPEMLEVMRSILSTALKDNDALRFAVVTGCLRIAKESIFTGTNNFVSDTISVSHLNEGFGFHRQMWIKSWPMPTAPIMPKPSKLGMTAITLGTWTCTAPGTS